MNSSLPLFSILMLTYNRTTMLREAVESVLEQTYRNLELVILENGAYPETIAVVRELSGRDPRIRVISFSENQYRGANPAKTMVDVCYNAGLASCRGTYVFYLQDDDAIAPDYVEKMVTLFKENSGCISAAGLPVAIDESGSEMVGRFAGTNMRPRFMDGRALVEDFLNGGHAFAAPGTIFTFPTQLLRDAGGYHIATETSQLLGIVPFGVTGFDETARCFWRYHQGQLNKAETASGRLGTLDLFDLLMTWKMYSRWERAFGTAAAQAIIERVSKRVERNAAKWFAVNFFRGRWGVLAKIAHDISYRPGFLLALPWAMLRSARMHLRMAGSHAVKPVLRHLVQHAPRSLDNVHWFCRLRKRLVLNVSSVGQGK